MMKPTFWRRLDLIARSATPLTLSFLIILFGMIPVGMPTAAPVLPFLPLLCVYYWTVHRPDLMPAWAVFLLGLFQDLLTGMTFGVAVFALLVVYAVIVSQRRFFASQNFIIRWIGFAVISLLCGAIIWVLIVVLSGRMLSPMAGVFQYLATVGAYPIFAWVFARTERSLLS